MARIKLAPPRRRPRRVARKVALRLGAKHHRDWIALYIRAAFTTTVAEANARLTETWGRASFAAMLERLGVRDVVVDGEVVSGTFPPIMPADLRGRGEWVIADDAVIWDPAAHNVVRQDRVVSIAEGIPRLGHLLPGTSKRVESITYSGDTLTGMTVRVTTQDMDALLRGRPGISCGYDPAHGPDRTSIVIVQDGGVDGVGALTPMDLADGWRRMLAQRLSVPSSMLGDDGLRRAARNSGKQLTTLAAQFGIDVEGLRETDTDD